MNEVDNKADFAENLNYYMEKHGKTRKEVADAIEVSYFTFCDWVNGKKYPRMDKVEKLASFFGVLKSDLIEKKTKEHKEMQEKNETIAKIVKKMMENEKYLEVVEEIGNLSDERLQALAVMLLGITK